MTTWQAGGQVQDMGEWRSVEQFCALVQDLSEDLNRELSRDKQWLVARLEEISRLMPEVLEESWHRPYLHEFVLGIHQALTYLTVLEYYVSFMDRQGYVGTERAQDVETKAVELRAELSSWLARMRRELLSRPDPGRFN